MADTRKEIEQQILERAMKDEDFRNKLQSDPKSTVEELFGTKLPDSLNIHVNCETPTDIYITLPASASGELSEKELSGISGGWLDLCGAHSTLPAYKVNSPD